MFEEGFHVLDFRGVQVPEISIEVMRVGKSIEGFAGQINSIEKTIGRVQHIDANFLFHHLALVLQVLGGKIQRLQAVGLQP